MKTLILFGSLLLGGTLHASTKYSKITKTIKNISKNNSFFEEINLGKNDQGKEIKGLLYKGNGSNKSKHLIVGTHHGNEILSADLVIKFVERLAREGSTYFKNKDLYIIPVLNIGGYDNNDRYEKDSRGRGHDPNRDYPDPCIAKKNFNLKSTSHLAALLRSEDIIGAVTVHGYYGSLTYPWGIYSDNYQTLDHALFHGKATKAAHENSYEVGTHADILYPAGGAFEDWAYYELGVWSLLVELENRPNWENDVNMLVKTVEQFPRTRSGNHQHQGHCTNSIDTGISRP